MEKSKAVLGRGYFSEDVISRVNKCPSESMIAFFVFVIVLFAFLTFYAGRSVCSDVFSFYDVVISVIFLSPFSGATVVLFIYTLSLFKERRRKVKFAQKKLAMNLEDLKNSSFELGFKCS